MLKLSHTIVRAAIGKSERLAALNAFNVPQLSAVLPRSWAPSMPQSNIVSASNAMPNFLATPSMGFRAAYAATRSGVNRSVLSCASGRLSTSMAPGARPLTRTWIQKRSYSQPKVTSWEDMPPMPTQIRQAPRPSIGRLLFRLISGLGGLALFALNGSAVWYLHSKLFLEDPTWVSYLSFVPTLQWIPMLDIAGLQRYWVALPLTAAVLGGAGLANMGVMVMFGLPLLVLEVYRNKLILDHFEQYHWATVLLWMLGFGPFITSSLAILGTEHYHIVPHKDSHPVDLLLQVVDRLNESLVHPEIMDERQLNVPFRLAHDVWAYFPQLKEYAEELRIWWHAQPAPLPVDENVTVIPVHTEEAKN